MKIRIFKAVCYVLIIMLNVLFQPNLYSQDKAAFAGDQSFIPKALLKSLMITIDPSLAAPDIYPEPEYTWGSTNTIFWNEDSLQNVYLESKLTIVAYEVFAKYDSTEIWGFVSPGLDSATFINLPEGIPIEYKLRYFAKDSTGADAISFWSEPETSIQDISPPVLDEWDIVHLQRSKNILWVVENTILNYVRAHDSGLGKVMTIIIEEKSDFVDNTVFYDLEPPLLNVDQQIPYTILTPENELVNLTLWVVDVAGQISNKVSVSFFWWEYEGEVDKVVCFPNPFNPSLGEASIIRVDDPEITEARVYDLFGNLIQVLFKVSEDNFFEWNGKNGEGEIVATGGYLCVVANRRDLYCKIAVVR